MDEIKIDQGLSTSDLCIQYGREMLTSQLPLTEKKGYDFAPPFHEMIVHLYLLGVMWRHGESLNLLIDSREHALAALRLMLVNAGMNNNKSLKHIVFLDKMSRIKDGSDALALTAGYQATLNDGSLDMVFDEHRDETRTSGALWRLYDRSKKIMLMGGGAAAFVAIWFVTIFIPSSTGMAILTAGIIAAAFIVIPTFIIGMLIYRIKFKN
ncbi:hypothetical protein LBMAG32_02480 [Nitrosomonadaceae bacterium]|nr:hypothetical protein [Nitrosomonadaceae bacterium]GDX60714.1 hypothetical protein LBMAG32_02480 [Nitrosomonadaceae bacterium]